MTQILHSFFTTLFIKKRKQLWTLTLLCFTFSLASGQPLLLNQSPDTILPLSPYTEIYIDKTANLSLEEIQTKWQQNQFISPDELQLEGKFQRGRYRYWMEFAIKNTHPTDTLECLVNAAPGDTLRFYKLKNGVVEEKVFAGFYMPDMPANPKLFIPANTYIPLKIPPLDSSQYFMMARNQLGVHNVMTRLVPHGTKPTETFLSTLYFYLWTAAFIGILFFVGLYGLIQFMLNKDKAFLYYGLYAWCICIHQIKDLMTNDHVLKNHSWAEFIDYKMHMPVIIGMYAFYILFIASFLNSKQRFPVFHRYLRFMLFIILGYGVLNQFTIRWDFFLGWELNYYFRVATTPFFIFLLIKLWLIKDKLARIVAWGTSILCLVTIGVTIWTILSPNYYLFENWGDVTNTGMQLGFLLELLFFMLGLSYRTKLITDENQQMEINLERQKSKTNELQNLNAFKSRFYTNITHEFRTPLTVIDGMAEQIRGNEEHKSLILHNSHRLLNLVNQMLDLSKLESNNLPIHWVQGNIIHFLSYLVSSFKSFAQQNQLMLSFHAHEEEVWMDYDPEKMERILINLLHNAIKFTPEYGEVKVSAKTLVQEEEAFLQIDVKDTGIGIKEAELPYIFDRFYTNRSGVSPDTSIGTNTILPNEGSGIGLALARELTHLLDGTIEASSQINIGTTFTLLFPIRQTAKKEEVLHRLKTLPLIENETTIFENSIQQDSELPLLLIVEDNADVIFYLQSILQKDYQILIAQNGKIGIDMAIEHIPDIIISDIMMPEKDGFEVCEILKNDRRTSHIPIILLTAKATLEDRISGISTGADAYLAKPFSKKELLVRLEKLVEGRKKLQEYYSTEQSETIEVLPDIQLQKENEFIQQLNGFIQQNISDEAYDIPQLCKDMTMSKTQLYRKVKALTGKAVALYVRAVKLKKARQLLRENNLSVSEVAEQMGFGDVSYFSRVFKKEFGFSPSERK